MRVLVGLLALMLTALVYGQDHSLDYEYLPHHDEQTVAWKRVHQAPDDLPQQVYDSDIQKCRCGGNEVRNDSSCASAVTIVAVTDPHTGKTSQSPTDAFGVTVDEVQCSQDQVKITLVPSRGLSHQFSLLPNGSLYWRGLAYDRYCFDHKLDCDGQMTWEADVCLPPPVVPRCYQSLVVASNGSYNVHSSQRFSPPVMVNEIVLQWPGEVTEESVSVVCQEYETLERLQLNTSQAHLTYVSGGVSLVWSAEDSTQNDQREGYCVEPEVGKESYVASVCYENQMAIYQYQCSNATCVRKCCPEKEIMDGSACVPVENDNQLWVPVFTDENDPVSSVEPLKDLKFLYGLPQCSLFQLDPYADKKDTFYLLNNGMLFRPDTEESYLPTQYCIENFMKEEWQVETNALVCFSAEPVQTVCSAVQKKVYPALLLVSSIFLGIILVVYISVPDIRDKLHGRCLISLVAALFVGYTLLATTRLASGTIPQSLCAILASVTHLSLLAAFFWLNVMCFDIWRTLRKTRTVVDGGREGRRRFLLYSLYAWGCPLVLTIVAVIVEQLPSSYDVIRPNISIYCWFQDQKAHWVYLYMWILLLVVANLIFFSLVATILCRAQNDPLLKRSREYNRERMWLYVKLFLVMGIVWLTEVVSWKVGACGALIVTDVINALQGLILFLVFVCKKTTWHKVRDRWGWCCGRAGKVANSPMTTLTSTLSSFSTSSSVSRKADSSLPSSVRSSLSSNRNTVCHGKSSTGSSGSKVRNVPSAVPLQTLQEVAGEPSKPFHGTVEETAKMIPMADQEVDVEVGTALESTPLKTTDSTLPPRPLETHFGH